MDRCRAEVDLSRLKKNFETIKGKCDDVFAVVKANAYGHGATEVAKTLEECGCKKFAVASVYEAESLRKNGINGEIAILGFARISGLPAKLPHVRSCTTNTPFVLQKSTTRKFS